MFKANSSGHNKTWEAQKNLVTLPLNALMATDLA